MVAMDKIARSRVAVQTWFIAAGGLTLASILALQFTQGPAALDPMLASPPRLIAMAAFAIGIAVLLSLLLRSRSVAVARWTQSLGAAIGFSVLSAGLMLWVFFVIVQEMQGRS